MAARALPERRQATQAVDEALRVGKLGPAGIAPLCDECFDFGIIPIRASMVRNDAGTTIDLGFPNVGIPLFPVTGNAASLGIRIIARNKLIAFWTKHPTTEASLRHWHEVAEAAAWQSPLDVVADFSKAKLLNGERVRFEVVGGDYRMVVAFDWKQSIAFIKFVGTHAEYDKIDALTVSLF